MERRYAVKYSITPGSFTKDELKKSDEGGCDGVIIHSILFPEDGSRDEMLASCGPDGKPLSGTELFKSWVAMAYAITQCDDIPNEGRKQVARAVFEHVRDVMREISSKKKSHR